MVFLVIAIICVLCSLVLSSTRARSDYLLSECGQSSSVPGEIRPANECPALLHEWAFSALSPDRRRKQERSVLWLRYVNRLDTPTQFRKAVSEQFLASQAYRALKAATDVRPNSAGSMTSRDARLSLSARFFQSSSVSYSSGMQLPIGTISDEGSAIDQDTLSISEGLYRGTFPECANAWRSCMQTYLNRLLTVAGLPVDPWQSILLDPISALLGSISSALTATALDVILVHGREGLLALYLSWFMELRRVFYDSDQSAGKNIADLIKKTPPSKILTSLAKSDWLHNTRRVLYSHHSLLSQLTLPTPTDSESIRSVFSLPDEFRKNFRRSWWTDLSSLGTPPFPATPTPSLLDPALPDTIDLECSGFKDEKVRSEYKNRMIAVLSQFTGPRENLVNLLPLLRTVLVTLPKGEDGNTSSLNLFSALVYASELWRSQLTALVKDIVSKGGMGNTECAQKVVGGILSGFEVFNFPASNGFPVGFSDLVIDAAVVMGIRGVSAVASATAETWVSSVRCDLNLADVIQRAKSVYFTQLPAFPLPSRSLTYSPVVGLTVEVALQQRTQAGGWLEVKVIQPVTVCSTKISVSVSETAMIDLPLLTAKLKAAAFIPCGRSPASTAHALTALGPVTSSDTVIDCRRSDPDVVKLVCFTSQQEEIHQRFSDESPMFRGVCTPSLTQANACAISISIESFLRLSIFPPLTSPTGVMWKSRNSPVSIASISPSSWLVAGASGVSAITVRGIGDTPSEVIQYVSANAVILGYDGLIGENSMKRILDGKRRVFGVKFHYYQHRRISCELFPLVPFPIPAIAAVSIVRDVSGKSDVDGENECLAASVFVDWLVPTARAIQRGRPLFTSLGGMDTPLPSVPIDWRRIEVRSPSNHGGVRALGAFSVHGWMNAVRIVRISDLSGCNLRITREDGRGIDNPDTLLISALASECVAKKAAWLLSESPLLLPVEPPFFYCSSETKRVELGCRYWIRDSLVLLERSATWVSGGNAFSDKFTRGRECREIRSVEEYTREVVGECDKLALMYWQATKTYN